MSAEQLLKHGKDFLNKNSLDSALICYSLAQSKTARFSDNKGKEEYLKSLNGIGVVSFLCGNYSQSYSMFAEAIDVDSTFTDSNMNIASLYMLFGERDLAKRHLVKAFHDYLVKGNYKDMSTTMTNILNLGILYDEHDETSTITETYLRLNIPGSEPTITYATQLAKGANAMVAKDYPTALSCFYRAAKLSDSIFISSREKSIIFADIAKCWEKIGNIDSAINYNKRSLSAGLKYDYADFAVRAGKTIADLFDKVGVKDSAMSYRYHALLLEDSLQTAFEYNNIKSFELQRAGNKLQSRMNQLQAERREKNLIIIFSWVVIAVLGLSIWLILVNNKKLKSKDRAIVSAFYSSDCDQKAPVSPPRFDQSDDKTPRQDDVDMAHDYAKASVMTDEQAEALRGRIIDIMENDECYLSKEKFTIADLADLANDRVKNVSYIINKVLGKNFNVFINEYRIRACVRRLKDDRRYRSYTIDHIAADFGFKSRSNFSKVFNSVMGMNPTSWIKIIRENDKES